MVAERELVRRRVFGAWAEATELLSMPDVFAAAIAACLGLMLLVPGAWLVAVPLGLVYGAWMSTMKGRLPFRLPLSWNGPDYSNPMPGSGNRHKPGEGLLYLGNDAATNEELWLGNSDARRHAFVLGTTGAGKCLPVDTLVLTPRGWVRNGDLRPDDQVIHPSGRRTNIVSVHPQGRLPAIRMHFADGRFTDCSHDHLWRVRVRARSGAGDSNAECCMRTQTAADIGIFVHMNSLQNDGSPPCRIFVPLPSPLPGPIEGSELTARRAADAAKRGLGGLGFMPSLAGTVDERLNWFRAFIDNRRAVSASGQGRGSVDIPALDGEDAFMLQQIVWSLGGRAAAINEGQGNFVRASFPGQEKVILGASECDPSLLSDGLEIVDVESHPIEEANDSSAGGAERPETGSFEMSCIRTDSDDGLFVAESYVVTHNTEFLLGLVSQSMIWSSGFLFIDGKGTSEFHGKAWSLVSRFGRQDDYRILNFTDGGGEPDMPAGGPVVQSNTLNPFSHGTPDQLMNLIASLMSDAGAGNDMWKNRAMSLVASTMKTLCEMRDAGDILLDVQSIRDHLPLGIGVKKTLLEGRVTAGVEDIPEAAWKELRTRGGMIELYLRALNGEFSDSSKLALKGFFDSLPGFNLGKALNGEAQEGKAAEQYGFLAMQLTKPLGSLADDFGHIFRTPFGEVDIEDVVLNRRILVVLLPALQKAPEEMRNCGKIVVAMLKMMMGKAAGSEVDGSKRAIIDARPTRSPSPFIVVLDEAGYYMVKGIDTMMAQARSLGFMIVIAGQDMAAMQSVSPQIAETASANARLTAAGAMEDAQRTWEFLRKKFGRHKVAVSTGRTARSGLFGMRWEDRGTASFVEEDRVSISDMQRLKEGEFYFLMESTLVKARTFYLGDRWTERISANKFVPVRGPRDRAPGLDQAKDAEFMSAYEAIGSRLLDLQELEDRAAAYPFAPDDILAEIIRDAGDRIERLGPSERSSSEFRDAFQLAMLFAAEIEIDDPDPDPEPDDFGWH